MAAALVRELLVTCAAARECVADEHVFTVTHGGLLVGTFRLQLFTASGVRPVAIATQTMGEGGSLASRVDQAPQRPSSRGWVRTCCRRKGRRSESRTAL